jgi:hypothetical protein
MVTLLIYVGTDEEYHLDKYKRRLSNGFGFDFTLWTSL